MSSRRTKIFGLALIAGLWLAYVVVGQWFAGQVNARLGAKILSASQGNVSDVKAFVQQRLFEGAVLASLAIGLALAQSFLVALLLKRRPGRDARWILHALFGFIGVNVWLAVAIHTALFWALFWQGRYDTAMLARNRLKRELLHENTIRCKAAILGNSQARSQINEEILNEELGTNLYTGELHFPGSHAFDIWLMHRHLKPTDVRVILCYVSESTFYNGINGETVPFIFGFDDWRDAAALGATRVVAPRKLGYGLLSDALPAFYLRQPLAYRVLGFGVGSIEQRFYNEKAQANPAANLDRAAANCRLNSDSDFQKRAFTAFAARCVTNGQTLVVIAGQLNPLLSDHFDPAVRRDMFAYLRNLQQQLPAVVLVDDYPAQMESDYEDLTHVNQQKQEQFTRFLAERLRVLQAAGVVPKS